MSEVAQPQQAQQSHHKSKTICLVALSGYWYLVSYNSDPTRFAVLDVLFSTFLVIAVVLVQAYLLSLVKQRRVALDLLAGLFLTCNLASLYFAFVFPSFWGLDWYVQVVVFALAWLLAKRLLTSFGIDGYWLKLAVGVVCALVALDFLAGLFFARYWDSSYFAFASPFPLLPRIDWYAQTLAYALIWLVAKQFFTSFAIGGYWRKLVVGVTCALFVFQVAVAAYFHEQLYLASQQHLYEEVTDSDTMTSSPNVRKVEFTQTPNVYFIVSESMLPESLASELLGIPSLEYARTLEANGFLRFPNYFSDAMHTLATLARVFSLDPQYQYRDESHIIAGYERSPLREIFRSNGYRTHLYTNISKFGFWTKGYYLDRYVVGNNLALTACTHMAGKPVYAIYGYCNFLEALKVQNKIGRIMSQRLFADFFLDDIKPLLEKKEPNLFVFYIKLTDHIYEFLPTPERQASFIEKYKQESKAAAVVMEEIMSFIRKNDPDSWQFIFADHGSLRFAPYHDNHEAVGRRLRILDNYGGMAAFYPPQACKDHFVSRQWSTTSMISRDILRCLAGGVDPFVNDVTYRYVEGGIDLTDYLYE